MNKKRVFFILPDLYYGGAQKTYCNVINNLSKKHSENIEFYLISINESKIIYNLETSIISINLKSKRTLFSIFKLIKVFLKFKPNYVFSTTIHINLVCIMLKFFFINSSFKLIIRESNPSFFRNDISLFLKFLIKIFYKFSDHIICLSEFVRSDIENNLKIGKNKISTIYNPIEISEIVKKSKLYNDLNFSHKSINLVFVGRLTFQKNVIFLISIIKNIKLPNLKLRIIGNGKDSIKIKSLISENNLKNVIEIIDYKKNPYPYIKKSDFFLLPSRWEGFGHVIAESIILDTPVIAINTKGIASIFFKSNYFNIINSSNIDIVCKKLKEIITNYQNNEIINNKSFLNKIDSNYISQRFVDLIY